VLPLKDGLSRASRPGAVFLDGLTNFLAALATE
jgi:hypothetical protein